MGRKTVVVVYEDDRSSKRATPSVSATAPTKPGTPSTSSPQAGPQQNQQIKRVEAKGNVMVVQKDGPATGDSGAFDMRANTVTMLGNVVISQGQNVVTGDTLTVDMTTGVSRISCGKAQEKCRVKGLFQPGAMKQLQEAAPVPTREPPRPLSPPPHSSPRQPQGLN